MGTWNSRLGGQSFRLRGARPDGPGGIDQLQVAGHRHRPGADLTHEISSKNYHCVICFRMFPK